MTKLIRLKAVCALLLALPSLAQDERVINQATARQTSPFHPPTKDTFVQDDGPGLDTGCTYNTDPAHPLRIDVMVDQAVGPVDESGFLVDPAPLIAEGVIPATVTVMMPAFDIDTNGQPPVEQDEVLLNGERLGFLEGGDQIWKLNSFTVPISKIKFPAPTPSGSTVPVANRVQVNVDTLSRGRWCTALDWMALFLPIKLRTAFTLAPIAGNVIRVRDYRDPHIIDMIHQQSFDSSCNLQTDIGGHDDYYEHPFSGPATLQSELGPITERAWLLATLKQCPANNHLVPQVTAAWEIANTSLAGVEAWSGNEGIIKITMPDEVGWYDVAITFTIDGKEHDAIHRKLFVTWKTPLTNLPPRLGWYEKATEWASGQSDESSILISLLSGLYTFGSAHWDYKDADHPDSQLCGWQNLVSDRPQCNSANCFVFSDVLQNMAAILGVGGLSPVRVQSNHRGFLTKPGPSLDRGFPGNAKPAGSILEFDRYFFKTHSLRRKGSRYYDATFNRIYSNPAAFIEAVCTGRTLRDANNREYLETHEGWRIYNLSDTTWYTWRDYEYEAPPSLVPGKAVRLASLVNPSTPATTDIAFTGNATYDLLDDNLDGIAEALTVDVEVRLNTSGQYLILGTLEKGGQPIADLPVWEAVQPVSTTFDGIAGTYTVALQFSGEQILRSGEDGPYDLVLSAIGTNGSTSASLATPNHAHTIFAEIPARLTGVSEAAVDTGGDGRFELIEAIIDLDVRLPGEIQLQGSLVKGEETLAASEALQNLTPGTRQVTLRFAGTSLRRSAIDGPYEGSVNLLDADDHILESITFTTRPYSAASFSAVFEPQAPFSNQGVDSNGNGRYDLLRIGFRVAAEQPGSYRLSGVLRSASNPSVVYADSQITLPAGSITTLLEFPGPAIHALGLDGPYTVDVLILDPATLEELDRVRLPFTTAAYSADQFDPFGASSQLIALTGNSSDSGVDSDGNGLFDELHVSVEVDLARTDFYEWSARLVDRNGTEIGFDTRRATLSAGVTSIPFVFDGEAIGKNGVDGPYFVKSLLIFGRSGANLVSLDVAETRPYPVTGFEGAGDFIPPQIAVASEPAVLWPPNHKRRVLAVTDFVVAAADNQDPNVSVDDVVITQVTSDEAGDGIVIAQGCRAVELRAERAGSGNGRVYTIHAAVADASGNVGNASYTVTVPHDSSGRVAVDDGPAYSVAGCAP